MARNIDATGTPLSQETVNRVWPTLRSALAMTVLFAIAVLVDRFDWANFGRFELGVEIDPLWLPVVVMSIHYGLVDGLIAALIACGVRFYFGESGFLLGEPLTAFTMRTGTEPLLWLLFALLVGGLRTRQNLATNRVRSEARKYLDRSDLLARHYSQLQARTESLERFVATKLSAAGSRNGRSNTASVYSNSAKDCISGLFATFNLALEGASFRIYLDNGAGLSLVRDNRRTGLSGADEIGEGSALYETVIKNRLPVCGVDSTSHFPPDCDGIFASPIQSRRPGRPIGMLLIDSIHPSRLTAECREFYKQVCVEIGTALEIRGFADLLEENDRIAPLAHSDLPATGAASREAVH